MLVYRYENKQGKGPYISDMFEAHYNLNYIELSKTSVYNEHKRPSPYVDVFNNYPNRHFNAAYFKYGFRSYRQLCKWFNCHHRRLLKKHEFTVMVYDIDEGEVYFGNKHVAFHVESEIYSIKELKEK